MLHLEMKKQIVEDVKAMAIKAHSIVVSDYRGLTVGELQDLRANARQLNVVVRVVRNRLAKIAFAGTNYECLEDVLSGPSIIAFSFEGAGAAAKVLLKFQKNCKKLEVKGLSIGEGLLGPERLAEVAKLPTRDEALAQLMSSLTSPVRSLAVGLQDTVTQLARALNAVAEQQ